MTLISQGRVVYLEQTVDPHWEGEQLLGYPSAVEGLLSSLKVPLTIFGETRKKGQSG